MKKLVLVLLLVFLGSNISFSGGNSNNLKPNPIPSYGQLVDNIAGFYEMHSSGNSTKEKRQINIRSTSINPKIGSFEITLWLVTDQGNTVLGPYFTECGEQVSYQIDNRKWGVIVSSDYPVLLDVWIDDGQPLP